MYAASRPAIVFSRSRKDCMKAAQSSTTCLTTSSSRSPLLAKWYEMTLLLMSACSAIRASTDQP
jgi:superfamily II RNA helicase